VNKIASRALNVGAGRGRLVGWVDGLKPCGERYERQLVKMHGGQPQKLELREENECRRDCLWNRLPMQMSHGQLASKASG